MGRPPTKPKSLRDGYYLEVKNRGSNSGIKIRRDTEEEMHQAYDEYKNMKDVTILGESKDGKWVNAGAGKKKS